MNNFKNVVEYFDELYPVTEEQSIFFSDLLYNYSQPAKILRIACGTGNLELQLAKDGHDVIALETSKDMLDAALRRRKEQCTNVRFLQMSTVEMVQYLKKNFYNVISCLNNRIIFIHDCILIKKFFHDCRQLLSPDGHLILHLYNYSNIKTNNFILHKIERDRVALFKKMALSRDGHRMSHEIRTGSGKVLPVLENVKVHPLTAEEISIYAKEAGFLHCSFYSDYNKTPFTAESTELLCHIAP